MAEHLLLCPQTTHYPSFCIGEDMWEKNTDPLKWASSPNKHGDRQEKERRKVSRGGASRWRGGRATLPPPSSHAVATSWASRQNLAAYDGRRRAPCRRHAAYRAGAPRLLSAKAGRCSLAGRAGEGRATSRLLTMASAATPSLNAGRRHRQANNARQLKRAFIFWMTSVAPSFISGSIRRYTTACAAAAGACYAAALAKHAGNMAFYAHCGAAAACSCPLSASPHLYTYTWLHMLRCGGRLSGALAKKTESNGHAGW